MNYADLALQHILSSPDTAYRIVRKAYDKILVELAIDEYIHIVKLSRKGTVPADGGNTDFEIIVTT